MSPEDLRALVPAIAAAHHLPPALILAMVEVESGWDPWAIRPEPAWQYYWNVRDNVPYRLPGGYRDSEYPPQDFPELTGRVGPVHEWWAQAMSWGLMQIMGAVARERGFRQPYLSALLNPATNIEWGCKVLASHLPWAGGYLPAAVAAYNGGRAGNQGRTLGSLRNASYVRRVQEALGAQASLLA